MASAGTAKATVVALACSLAGCAAEMSMGVELQHANARAPFQTAPETIRVFDGDITDAYDVLGDLQVIARQRGAFGTVPTRDEISRKLQTQSGRLGAHAVIMFSCGDLGSSLWSYHELRCQGRAIRLR